MTSLWKNYDAKSSYDEYLTPERKLRREAKIISSILDRHGKKKLQEIDRNCMSTIDSRGINFKVYSLKMCFCFSFSPVKSDCLFFFTCTHRVCYPNY